MSEKKAGSRKITVVTGNSGKVASFRRYLEPLGFDIAHEDLCMIEPQLDKIEAIALDKARQAYKILKKPLLVEDTGFYIEALNDFPGPYNKYVIEKIGVNGYLALMAAEENRECKFFSALVYIDEQGTEHIFTKEVKGKLAEKPDDKPLRQDAKSELWKIFIPAGQEKTLNEIEGEERKSLFKTWENNSVAALFANWIDQSQLPLGRKPPKKNAPKP
jgi:XTP/dITP diphosphohydrolase